MNTIKNKLIALFAVALLTVSTAFAATPPSEFKSSKELTRVERQIRSELIKLPFVGVFDNLSFKVENNVVTLYGSVVTPASRRSAEKRIVKIEGVSSVINNIEVLPASGFDNSIRERTLNELAESGLYRYFLGNNPSVRIIVKNGNVALEGLVSNTGDARLANILANGISGVFSVTNNLQVENGKRL